MTNNDISRRLRFTFDLNDNQVINVFVLAGSVVNRVQICERLKKDND